MLSDTSRQLSENLSQSLNVISLPAGDVPAASGSALALAQAALAELGYRPQEITAALRSFDPEGMKTEEIVRQCLRAMVMR